jgi:hypothetical protein
MPRLDPATRNIAIGRLKAGESQNEIAQPQRYRMFGAIHGIFIFQRRSANVTECQI